MAKVSIIVPVYGVEDYIEHCVSSLLEQTLDDMEFIFVDDHSPDSSMDIVRRLVKGHPREKQFVFVQTPQNGGAGPARNYGLTFATGEYIGFVDSDDWVSPEAYRHLYEAAKASDVDLCYGHAVKHFEDGHHDVEAHNPIVDTGEFTHDRRASFLVNYAAFFTTFIYRRSFLEAASVGFYSSGWSEDSYFLACALFSATTIASIPDVFYHYRIRPNSASTRTDGGKYLTRMAVYDDVMTRAKQTLYEEFKDEVDFLYIKKGILSTARDYVGGVARPKASVLRSITVHLCEQLPQYKRNPYLRRSLSISALLGLMSHCPLLAIQAFNVLDR